MANQKPTLYIGVTNNLERRIYEHQNDLVSGFSSTYKTHRLVYFEETSSIEDAIRREKQLKNWHRDWKLNLISELNPGFDDLSEKSNL